MTGADSAADDASCRQVTVGGGMFEGCGHIDDDGAVRTQRDRGTIGRSEAEHAFTIDGDDTASGPHDDGRVGLEN